jgi:hypothetical protein
VRYRETVWSDVFPGNYHTSHCVQPAVVAAETALELALAQHCRIVWRLDGGAGSDEHLRWLFSRDYQVVAKGMNNHRAEALARQVRRWDAYRADTWLGTVQPPADYGRPVRMWVKKQRKDGVDHHSYYVSSLVLPSKTLFMTAYDERGTAEIEQFRNDKSGLSLEARRKHSFCGQKGYILLTDLAHNLLADFAQRALVGTPFANWGLKRIVRDLLAMPGQLTFTDNKLTRVDLLSQKQFAQDLAPCLERYCTDRSTAFETACVCTIE